MSADTSPRNEAGLDLDELDPSVRPQDDLYLHVNGSWIARTEIPADKARYGSFHILAEEAEKAIQEIILESRSAEPGTEERKVGDLYASFMDEERIDALGAAPIAADLAAIGAIGSIPALLVALGANERVGGPGLFSGWVDNDPGDPERYLVFIEQAGLGLPDESYYREEKFAPLRARYLAHIERMFALVGIDDAAGRAARVLSLETAIAAEHWDNVRTRDDHLTYNLMPWADLAKLFGGSGADLDPWRAALGAPEVAFDHVIVREPDFVAGLGALLVEDRLLDWLDWLRWHTVRGAAGYLSSEISRANFEFYGTALSGTPEQRARWKRGVSLVEGGLGEAVGRIYVDRHFPHEAKESMDVLVANLIEAYRQSIEVLDWMGLETRQRALDKLSKFTPKIGYPVKWRDYSSLDIDPADLIGNVRALSAFSFDREYGKVGKAIDRDEWFMTPQTINAYYNPGFNEIVFPAAILQYPFFDADRDAAANYGAIGAVIGHEIGHGFDDQGSKFDGDGRLLDWWTHADRAAFERRTASLIEQYNALAPTQVPDHHVNGALTIGENIGDLGGLSIAWKAYLISLAGAEPPVVDGLSGAQRFFLSWAQSWQQKARDEEVIRLLATDPHSPNEFRTNQIVRNIDAFYEAFGVVPSDALWLPAEKRVTIW